MELLLLMAGLQLVLVVLCELVEARILSKLSMQAPRPSEAATIMSAAEVERRFDGGCRYCGCGEVPSGRQVSAIWIDSVERFEFGNRLDDTRVKGGRKFIA